MKQVAHPVRPSRWEALGIVLLMSGAFIAVVLTILAIAALLAFGIEPVTP
jgi:hypothetical protein